MKKLLLAEDEPLTQLRVEAADAAKDDPRFEALLLPDRTPTPLAGNALVVVDSAEVPAARLNAPDDAGEAVNATANSSEQIRPQL